MAIPKKYKKSLMKEVNNLEGARDTVGKKKKKWIFNPGDLVMTKAGVWGIIVEETNSGYFWIMSSSGRLQIHAKELERIQRNKCEKQGMQLLRY